MKGFTLIELVVAVSISLLVTGGIIINYNSYNAVQSLKQASLTLKNDFRFIQAKAANGEKPATLCPTLSGWTLSFFSGSYSYQASCGGAATGSSTVVQLPPGVTFSPIPAPNTITFNVLTRGTNLTSPLTVILRGSGKQYTLQITPSGDISDIGVQ